MCCFACIPVDDFSTPVVQNSFDEAYETSEFEEDSSDDEHENPLQRQKADIMTLQKLENSFRRLSWARESSSFLKRFLTKIVFERLRNRVSKDGSTLYDVIQAGVENLVGTVGSRVVWSLVSTLCQPFSDFWGHLQDTFGCLYIKKR